MMNIFLSFPALHETSGKGGLGRDGKRVTLPPVSIEPAERHVTLIMLHADDTVSLTCDSG